MIGVLLAAAVALLVALLGTRYMIRFLVRRQYGQFIRDDGPTTHHTKRGTPLFCFSVNTVIENCYIKS